MGIVVSAVASGLVQNISRDFVREEEERKVRWAGEAELVTVQGGREEGGEGGDPWLPSCSAGYPSLA